MLGGIGPSSLFSQIILNHFRLGQSGYNWHTPKPEVQSLEQTFHIHFTHTGGLNMASFETEENLQFDLSVVCGDRSSGEDHGISRKEPDL